MFAATFVCRHIRAIHDSELINKHNFTNHNLYQRMRKRRDDCQL